MIKFVLCTEPVFSRRVCLCVQANSTCTCVFKAICVITVFHGKTPDFFLELRAEACQILFIFF